MICGDLKSEIEVLDCQNVQIAKIRNRTLDLNSGKMVLRSEKNLLFILDDDNGKLNGGSDDLSRGPRRHG